MSSVDREEEELINQIELEMRKVHISVEKLFNNLFFSESDDPIEKRLITNSSYSACLLERGLNDGNAYRNDNALKMLEDTLSKEVDFLTNDIDKLLERINEHNVFFSSIDRNIANLNAMMEASNNDVQTVRKVDDISKHLKIRFKKEKAELKTIISSLFTDNFDIQDLIARIIDHHFAEGSDKYLQLENVDNIMEQIELLRRTNLFDINPHDILQIRLADLV